jgi:hypothetical protein
MSVDVNALVDWESGALSEEEEFALFQALVDTGLAWSLQGAYGRHAMRLIEAGAIRPPTRRAVP